MRTIRLTESTEVVVALTSDEATKLRTVGQALASQSTWWGAEPTDDEESSATVVRCHAVSGSEYAIRVSDAIGAIGLGDTQLIVDPKIPLPHLLYLFARSDHFPRHLSERSLLGTDSSFFLVVATWFVEQCETLLRHGLISDYGRITGDVPCARGRIHAAATSRSILVGRPMVRCDYDVRSDDTSLNRVVRAAVLRLLAFSGLPHGLRRHCRQIEYRLSDVGDLRHGDMWAQPDALTRIYRDVIPLALLILEGSGVAMHQGAGGTWTFLCRTPEAVEAGLRSALSERLSSRWTITKKGMVLVGEGKRTLNPDLVFGPTRAVGDVKYKLSPDGGIRRADLNQVTTFATGYGVTKATVIAFGDREVGEYVQVGRVAVNGFIWNTREPDPHLAADRLAENVEHWLEHAGYEID